MSTIRTAFKVHGTVQGVGFRDFAQKRAIQYGLKGWVKNTSDGKSKTKGLKVEGEAQGDGDSMQKFFVEVNQGPRLSHVTKVEKKDIQLHEGEDHFGVKRTSDSILDFSS